MDTANVNTSKNKGRNRDSGAKVASVDLAEETLSEDQALATTITLSSAFTVKDCQIAAQSFRRGKLRDALKAHFNVE